MIGPVILALEGEEIMDGGDRLGVSGRDPDLSTPGQLPEPVANPIAPGGHGRGTGNRLIVHQAGDPEIAPLKGGSDFLEVMANRGYVRRVGRVALQLDTASVGQGFEPVGGSVLVHSHLHRAPRLQRPECAVGAGRISLGEDGVGKGGGRQAGVEHQDAGSHGASESGATWYDAVHYGDPNLGVDMRRILCWPLLFLPASLAAQTIGVPERFAPGVVSTGDDYTHSLSITADGKRVYFTRQIGRDGPFIFMSDWKDGAWQPPVLAPFNHVYGGSYESLSPDGRRLWYSTKWPINDDTARATIQTTPSDMFYVDLTGDHWSDPVRLSAIVNSNPMQGYPAPTASGNLYYHARASGADRDNVDVWRAVMVNGEYQAPVALPINFDGLEGEPAPDQAERWLIYMSLRPGGKGDCDLWVTYPTATGWSAPENLEGQVNTEACEWTPKLSPDGTTLYFARVSGGGKVSDIYRVKLDLAELARRAARHR